MGFESPQPANRSWSTRRDEKKKRMQSVSAWMDGPLLRQEKLVQALELLIAHIEAKGAGKVWWATHGAAAEYVRKQANLGEPRAR